MQQDAGWPPMTHSDAAAVPPSEDPEPPVACSAGPEQNPC